MKLRPILFSAPMVRSIVDGSKTQTRRIVKPQFTHDAVPAEMSAETPEGWQTTGHSGRWWCDAGGNAEDAIRCPYGIPGDRLWVREAIRHLGDGISIYDADQAHTVADAWPWKRNFLPPMHCPRGLSRIDLEVTGVRVERLNDCSADDAYAEGAALWAAENAERLLGEGMKYRNIVEAYKALWEDINGAGSWAANPWVWVVEFKRVDAGAMKQAA